MVRQKVNSNRYVCPGYLGFGDQNTAGVPYTTRVISRKLLTFHGLALDLVLLRPGVAD